MAQEKDPTFLLYRPGKLFLCWMYTIRTPNHRRFEAVKRREFIKRAGLVATWLGVSVVLQACGDDDNPVALASPGSGDIAGTVGTNHGHAVTITGAQIAAGNSVLLTMGGGSHSHTVSLTAEQVGEIGAGMRVQVTSSTNGSHAHSATFN